MLTAYLAIPKVHHGWLCVIVSLLLLSFGQPSVAADEARAPDFELPLIANGSGATTLSGLHGNVVYVDFWASWCGPCRRSLPALDELYREFVTQDFVAIGISIDVVAEDALDFLTRYPVSFPVALDVDGAVPERYGVNGMPSGYLIDRTGAVRDVHVGYKKEDITTLRTHIRRLLAEPAESRSP